MMDLHIMLYMHWMPLDVVDISVSGRIYRMMKTTYEIRSRSCFTFESVV